MRPQINWIDRLTTDQKVGGSSPSGRTIQKINCYYLLYIITSTREVAQFGRAFGLGPKGRRFKSCLPDHYNNGPLAQLGEHLPCTQGVDGSIPLGSTIFGGVAQLVRAFGSYPKGREFKSLPRYHILFTDLQLSWLEHPAHNRTVIGSSPIRSTILKLNVFNM